MNKQNLFNYSNYDQDEFLNTYWHKKPLLLRSAVSLQDLQVLPNKKQLQQLSCYEDIQSRIVFKQSESEYQVEYGPFEEQDWQGLTSECWNLLVSDIDKWHAQSRKILHYFNFIRNWIFDDIMLSCGSINGTVGPHTDHYDVFLIQVSGSRKWSFSQDKIYDPKLIPKQALKLMAQFKADESHELHPGDVLYLPPEVAHYGIATSDDCVTCSIGMRTPSHSELITSYVDHIAQKLSANLRFEEPLFSKSPKKGEITVQDIENFKNILKKQLCHSYKIEDWLGQYLSEYRSLFYEFNQQQEIDLLKDRPALYLSPFSKCCYIVKEENCKLFVNGTQFNTTLRLAECICNTKSLSRDFLLQCEVSEYQVVQELFAQGAFLLSNTSSTTAL